MALENNFYFLGLRPKKLSGDKAETKDVLKFEIKRIEKLKKKKYANILLLQATVPFRHYKKIFLSLKKINSKTFDSLSVLTLELYILLRKYLNQNTRKLC